MTDNPYQAPASTPADMSPAQRSPSELFRLHGIAQAQRRLMLAVLGQFGLFFGIFIADPRSPHANTIIGLIFIVIAIAAIFYTIQLAARLKGTGVAVAIGIFSLIPYLGLIPMLITSSWATKALRAAGFKVGLLGGNPSEVQRALQASGHQL